MIFFNGTAASLYCFLSKQNTEIKPSVGLFHLPDAVCVSVPPTLLGSDEVRTLMVPINGHLTLECLADSDQAPEIEWFKDEAKVQVVD